MPTEKITVKGIEISCRTIEQDEFILLTVIAKYKNTESPSHVIGNRMRTRSTIDNLTIWETFYNPHLNPTEIGGFRNDRGLKTFTLSPRKWIEMTAAKRPAPPEGPRHVHGMRIVSQRAHAYACGSIINMEYIVGEQSQSNADRQGMGKI